MNASKFCTRCAHWTNQTHRHPEAAALDGVPEPGTRIELVHTSDPHTKLRPGAQGTAGRYSELGGLSVAWDDGSCLSLLPDEGDAWRAP